MQMASDPWPNLRRLIAEQEWADLGPEEGLRAVIVQLVYHDLESVARRTKAKDIDWPRVGAATGQVEWFRALANWARDRSSLFPNDGEVRAAADRLGTVPDVLQLLRNASPDERARLATVGLIATGWGGAKWNSPRGRPRGSGLADKDRALVEEISRRAAGGEPKRRVAQELALEAKGGGTLESKADRLLKRERREK